MKIKANKKFSNLDPQSIPCDVSIRKGLKSGKVVDVEQDVADKLLAMKIAEQVSNKKSKKSKENK